jgi:hypothetical protein
MRLLISHYINMKIYMKTGLANQEKLGQHAMQKNADIFCAKKLNRHVLV